MTRPQIVIENPILNGPYGAPTRHFRFDDEGITDDVVDGRRPSSYFMPIPKAKKKGGQLVFDEWTGDRIEENRLINQIRDRVDQWRRLHWHGVTPTTRSLLEYWTDPERERPLFFCQIEALETAIYLTEAAKKLGDPWIENELRTFAEDANPGLFRLAHKMATGTGKTVVMAMLIAWHTLNKVANPKDGRFGDAFLIVAPGITIRDRLRVLLPSDPENYYRQRDIVPPDRAGDLGRAKILITNFHAFQLREKIKAPKLTKELAGQRPGVFTETADEMVRRVTRELGTKRNLVVINDEAHHCYRRRVGDDTEVVSLTGEDRREAAKRDEEARVWITGLQAVAAKTGVRVVYDLSATPFYLRGSGWPEGTLFQWVVSDFSLVDAIEAGLVKIPRVPVDDNAAQSDDLPTYRGLWLRIRDDLPKKGRKTDAVDGREPSLPGPLEGAIQSLYGNYEKAFRRWQETSGDLDGSTPPVFIVVCNNTNVSKLVFDYVAGWAKPLAGGGSVAVPGKLELFSNVQAGRWSSRPKTVLVDSTQLESGDAMSPEFKAAAAVEIEEFKSELRQRFPGRDVDELTDEDLLREVMNTVGKPGKLGEEVRCVVSVSMLTEGWDANTVTHVLGVRAFGTQLLCEQVVGRGLRRRSYVVGDDGRFEPEYAEVYGVPFSFIPASGSGSEPKLGPIPERVGYFCTRVVLLEVLSVAARPVSVSCTASVEREPTGRRLFAGVERQLGEAALLGRISVALSAENNFATRQTSVGVTMIGTVGVRRSRRLQARVGDAVVRLGTSRVGRHATWDDPEMVTVGAMRDLVRSKVVREVVPLGSGGARSELEQFARRGISVALEDGVLAAALGGSAGPATSVLVVLDPRADLDVMLGGRWPHLPTQLVGHVSSVAVGAGSFLSRVENRCR